MVIEISLTLESEPIEKDLDTGTSLPKLPLKSRYGGLN